MKDTAKQAASQVQAAPALPSLKQVIALSITKATSDLQRIVEMRSTDEHWDDDDVHVDFAVELALTHIERMKTMAFEGEGDFSYEWFKVAGALNLGLQTFSRKDCAYFRMLKGACGMFNHLAGLVEFTEKVAA